MQARRWSRQYRTRLVREEVSDLESVHDLGTLELLAMRLPELVGSPLSINALREDLEVSHRTLGKWLDVLERLYAVFRPTPFGAPKLRAIKKARKHYHFDWTLVSEPGLRFENLVAGHLMKWVHFQQDERGPDWDLRFIRDVDGREVDFVVVDGRTPVLLVECKWADDVVSRLALPKASLSRSGNLANQCDGHARLKLPKASASLQRSRCSGSGFERHRVSVRVSLGRMYAKSFQRGRRMFAAETVATPPRDE